MTQKKNNKKKIYLLHNYNSSSSIIIVELGVQSQVSPIVTIDTDAQIAPNMCVCMGEKNSKSQQINP